MTNKFYGANATGSTIDLSANPPSAGQAGIAWSVSDSTGTSGVGPGTGWTQRGTWQVNTVDAQSLAVWTKDTAWAGGETSLGMTTSSVTLNGCAALDGVDISGGPLDIAVIQVNDNTASASPGTIGSGNFTPVSNGAIILAVMGTDVLTSQNVTHSFSGGSLSWTVGADQNSGFYNVGVGIAVQTTAALMSVTGTGTYASGNAGRSMFVLVLKPSAAAPVNEAYLTMQPLQPARRR